MSNYIDVYNSLCNDYKVENLISNSSKYFFILESPHKKEIQFKAPVSGNSGRSMAKNIFGKDISEPLGLIVKNHHNNIDSKYPLANHIGLINVCQIPMQGTAYTDSDYNNNKNFISLLEFMREKYNRVNLTNEQIDLGNMIVNKFKDELIKIIDIDCFIIPCGNFATKYFEKTGLESHKWKIVDGIPHPSYNLWNRNKETMITLNNIVK